MKWANKIMTNNQDQSQSKLSNRSLSKFRKVNLQKSDAEISSNEHLEKSVLKLASVQKIKTTNLNQSFISNYVASGHGESQRSSRQQYTQNQFFDHGKSKEGFENSESSKSVQIQYQKILDFGSEAKDCFNEGLGLFEKGIHETVNQQKGINVILETQNPENLSHQQRLKRVLMKIQGAMTEFKEVSQSIKKSMNENVSTGFIKIQNEILTCTRQFQASIQNGILHMIKLITKERRPSRFKTQNLVNTNQVLPPSPSNDSFYKIQNFNHESTQLDTQKQMMTSRPNKFKNHFKQMINDSNNENFMTKNPIEVIQNQKSPKKLVRKQTNPVNRVNPLARDDSSRIHEDTLSNANDKSLGSIKYSRVQNRSASKSVQKLHEKLSMIKKIFNGIPNSNPTPNEEAKILVQNNS